MIQKISHTAVYVLDAESAKKFYTEKLGFDVNTDAKMENGFRWLTVSPKGQPDLEVTLMEVKPGMALDEASAAALRALVQKGVFGVGVLETSDCRGTYEELKAKGVEFKGPPQEQFYGIECVLKDDSGNWWSMSERPKK